MVRQLTGIIEREGDGYVALCPELDIASQGDTVEEARANLIEAVQLFFECADPEEVKERLHPEIFIPRLGGRGRVGFASSPGGKCAPSWPVTASSRFAGAAATS